jgi:mono/diheme cytochrome c family protein
LAPSDRPTFTPETELLGDAPRLTLKAAPALKKRMPSMPLTLPEVPRSLVAIRFFKVASFEAKMAAGPVWSDEPSAKHGLYRRHCAHCHGISGDGHGPTAMLLNPYPRDYRPALFKFKGTGSSKSVRNTWLLWMFEKSRLHGKI